MPSTERREVGFLREWTVRWLSCTSRQHCLTPPPHTISLPLSEPHSRPLEAFSTRLEPNVASPLL